ncbi:MAG: protein phosphatase 2C domain-containing protein [Alphaproteobacteria bacterium]|nr:protein phosphatase 2C domain-containing protein [Alphaproteobacteria bacterium]
MIRFEPIDHVSLPGRLDKPNEDAFAFAANAAVVLDGATGLGDNLMPGESDAAWLAQFGARRLMAYVEENQAPRATVRRAMEDAAKSFTALWRRPPREPYEVPFASMMMLVNREDGCDALWFGDCAALVKPPGQPVSVIGDTLAKRELESARVANLAARHGLAPATGHDRPEFLQALRRARNLVNSEKGGWLFGPDPAAADHGGHRRLDVRKETLVLLATDGFLALVSDYRRYNAEELFATACSSGLENLGRELRGIEAVDADGKRYPRFKTSDDATAVLLSAA